ncbi:glycosyltransferase family 2 protein [Pontibaca methylaminivorans]|uniref:Glycosyltransferase, GT2 family n=1 Tax=Pontibaca methylaminivorans TaxID=515897 RepID=A0A1R3WZX4_9RHOB|nr:glycosyltransferase [Pontibaca methylaminivorans]SIT84118.1 Glycosyltransferase, GT2 family [Pontibaca methylaminivorans]
MTGKRAEVPASAAQRTVIDAVVIGRNEGARLLACLASLAPQVRRIVYVDSGSNDGSAEAARKAGAEVVALDMRRPFTAARARNAGLALLEDAEHVQFVDGDCIVQPDWIATAAAFLADHPEAAVVCGRRREEHPEASVYNRLCDAEWNTPCGLALACGGDALMRLAPLRAAQGYREDLIAGEEPELCLRLRERGWQIWRIDAEMTLHDARIHSLRQWARRARRAGHAFAEGAFLHGPQHWGREARRALFWGAALPLATLLLALVHPVFWLLLLAYPAQVTRLALREGGGRDGWQRAFFTTLGKFPESWGVIGFHLSRWRGRRVGLIEYK